MRCLSFALAVALLPIAAAGAEKSTSGIETSHISADFVAVWIAHPRRMLNNKLVKLSIAEWDKFEKKETSEKLFGNARKELGVDPRKIEQFTMLMDRDLVLSLPGLMRIVPVAPGGPGGGPGGGPAAGRRPPTPIFSFIVRFSEPVDRKAVTRATINILRGVGMGVTPRRTIKILKKAGGEGAGAKDAGEKKAARDATTSRKFAGKTYEVLESMGICFVDDKTLLVSHETLLKRMIAAKEAKSPLLTRLATLPKDQDVILAADMKPWEMMFKTLAGVGFGVSPDFAKLLDYLSKTKTLAFSGSLSGKTVGLGMADMPDKATAAGFAKLLNDWLLKQIKTAWESERKRMLGLKDPVAGFAVKLYDEALAGTKIVAKGDAVTLRVERPKELQKLPVVVPPIIKAQRRAALYQARRNALKQIGLAMHNYHDAHKRMPGNGSNGAGTQKGLSWRVHILPFIEQEKLYKQFKLDEAWDSKHNKKLIAKMPDLFKTPGVKDAGKTAIHVFVGKGTPFGAKDKGPRFADIVDGTSYTFLAVEAGTDKADVWTKPGGLPFDPKVDPFNLLGKITGGGFHSVMMDGSVRFISQTLDKRILRRLIQHRDGEPLGDF